MSEAKPAPEALEAMRESPYNYPSTKWAAYENHAPETSIIGELRFLAVGPENTYKEAPRSYPDTKWLGTGLKFVHIGWVDLQDGVIKKRDQEAA